MKTPERQLQHNGCSGFDHDETAKIVRLMEKTLKAQARLLVAYRTGKPPPEWVFEAIKKARKAGLEV